MVATNTTSVTDLPTGVTLMPSDDEGTPVRIGTVLWLEPSLLGDKTVVAVEVSPRRGRTAAVRAYPEYGSSDIVSYAA